MRVLMDPGMRRVEGIEMKIPRRSVGLRSILDDIAGVVGLGQGWERDALILINGNPSHHLGGHDVVVSDGDRISIVRPMGGG